MTLQATEIQSWLCTPVMVEEKLDGANVALWWAGETIQVASRGGPGARDRGNQLGRLRAWAATRVQDLQPLLSSGRTIYGEWLWRRHTVHYDALPDFFVLLDITTEAGTFLGVDERDRHAVEAGLETPPRVFTGVLGSMDTLRRLLGRSAYSSELAEGLVVRRGVERVKFVRPGFVPRGDDDWGAAGLNALAQAG